MIALSSTCLAIALADKVGSLRLIERASRFGDTFIAIEDAKGIIETAIDWAEADQRISAIRERVA